MLYLIAEDQAFYNEEYNAAFVRWNTLVTCTAILKHPEQKF